MRAKSFTPSTLVDGVKLFMSAATWERKVGEHLGLDSGVWATFVKKIGFLENPRHPGQSFLSLNKVMGWRLPQTHFSFKPPRFVGRLQQPQPEINPMAEEGGLK